MKDLMFKPDYCRACPYYSIGQGFVPDFVPQNPKVALLLEAGGEDEMIERAPLVGGTGKIMMKMCERVGWSRSDIMICNVLHTHPPGNKYPTGELRKSAEKHCSHWLKDSLDAFNPNWFLFTIHPAVCLRSWTLTRLLRGSWDTDQGDLEKAKRLVDSGKRLVVLCGDKAKQFVFPDNYPAGIMRLRGHHGKLNWAEVKERYGI